MGSAVATDDLLGAIVAGSRRTVEVRAAALSLDRLEREAAGAAPRARAFLDTVSRADRVNVIAECKRRSPSRGVLVRHYDPAAIARRYEEGGAAAVSVLTEPTFFDGQPGHLRAVRAAVSLPVLRKDFIVQRYQVVEARAWGADAVLLIVAALDDRELTALIEAASEMELAALVEVHDAEELRRALGAGAVCIGVNNRNLRTLTVDLGACETLARLIPGAAIAVAESGLRTADEIRRLRSIGYRGFLMGEALMTSADPAAALRRLRDASGTPA
jgi:indole-3-glycerol phosphate synthase